MHSSTTLMAHPDGKSVEDDESNLQHFDESPTDVKCEENFFDKDFSKVKVALDEESDQVDLRFTPQEQQVLKFIYGTVKSKGYSLILDVRLGTNKWMMDKIAGIEHKPLAPSDLPEIDIVLCPKETSMN